MGLLCPQYPCFTSLYLRIAETIRKLSQDSSRNGRAIEKGLAVPRRRRLLRAGHGPLCYSRFAAFGVSPARPALDVVMKKTSKIVLIVVGVLIVLVLVEPFLIPVNQLRATIEKKASVALVGKV